VAASGKVVSAYDLVRQFALGADWVNMARPFMFAVGCIQARQCSSGKCPTGVATMDPARYRVVGQPLPVGESRAVGEGTAEGTPFSRAEMDAMLGLADQGIRTLISLQKQALGL
jgi:glutamate synthase domain-containing protein 2